MTEPTNKDRAERAKATLMVYAIASGDRGVRDATLVALLADLRHYCDEYPTDFAAADKTAHQYYLTKLKRKTK